MHSLSKKAHIYDQNGIYCALFATNKVHDIFTKILKNFTNHQTANKIFTARLSHQKHPIMQLR